MSFYWKRQIGKSFVYNKLELPIGVFQYDMLPNPPLISRENYWLAHAARTFWA